MALFTTNQLKNRARTEARKSMYGSLTDFEYSTKSLNSLRNQLTNQKTQSSTKVYDIFLSHSSKDAEIVEGLRLELQDKNFSVYVDWIDDPQLDRNNVTKQTAVALKERMQNSRSLIYAFSENGSTSKWMPWELGFFDGIKGTATVLPILSNSSSDGYAGSEYLGIYNYIVVEPNDLYVHEDATKYVSYKRWLNGAKP